MNQEACMALFGVCTEARGYSPFLDDVLAPLFLSVLVVGVLYSLAQLALARWHGGRRTKTADEIKQEFWDRV